MAYQVKFNEEKNQVLLATRGICFDNVIEAIKNNDVLANKKHHNQKFKHEYILVIKIETYAYAVPYVINPAKQEIFLKTIYPSRALTRKYIQGEKNDQAITY